jgi:DNA-directed RNA polymerase subunit beta
MVGAEINEGDILVGKVTPKGQVDVSAEEKLLQIIFGNKTKLLRDSSLKVPTGGEGTVIKTQHFSILNGDELDDDVIEM